jgi:hypothetical protein
VFRDNEQDATAVVIYATQEKYVRDMLDNGTVLFADPMIKGFLQGKRRIEQAFRCL